MLPPAARMRRPEEFRDAMRRGRRAGTSRLVVHVVIPSAVHSPGDDVRPASPRVGFAVPRAVGGSVVRNTVVRRLRAQVRERLDRWPAGTRVVVRAMPPAAGATSDVLGRDLDSALGRALRAAGPAAPAAPGGPQ